MSYRQGLNHNEQMAIGCNKNDLDYFTFPLLLRPLRGPNSVGVDLFTFILSNRLSLTKYN